jgi:hypothetical protein
MLSLCSLGFVQCDPEGPNQALEQTRDNVLRYGEVVGCELLNFFVRPLDMTPCIQ